MRTAYTLLRIFLVTLAGVAIVCIVNAPKWMDGPTTAATRSR